MKSILLIKPYFVQNRAVILLGIACLIVVDFLQLFIPRIVKWAVDDLTALQTDLGGLGRYALAIASIGIFIGLFRYVWRRCLIGTSRVVEQGLRNRLFDHFHTLSAAYFDRSKTGDLMAHATNDIQHIRMATGMGMVALTDAIVLGTAAIVFMCAIDTTLTLFVMIPMPLIVFGTRFFSRRMHQRYQDVQGKFADLTETARESFAGIRILKAYNREQTAVTTFEKTSRFYVRSNLKLVRITGSFFPLMLLFSNLSIAIVLYLGGRQTIYLNITAGDFVAFISYLGLLTWPMMAMGWVTNLIQRGKASLDRIHTILQTPSDIVDRPDALDLTAPRGTIAFENVSFSYPLAASPALTGINLTLSPGGVLGIVGPPGSGKSTLLRLIPRCYDVTKGRIRFDGIDLRRLHTRSLRGQIALMPQEPFLFADTIRRNITFGDHRFGDDHLNDTLKAAALSETIASLPDGLETVVGEKGIVLSGGQKQRISLARAMLHPALVLLLDDPVSQVDTATGARIIDAIRSLADRRTLVIVSHRLSALRHADTIVTLDTGQIVAAGTHAELIKQDGYYARTFRMQEMEEELNAD